jgi:RimJ/RimL family protein N-acetyltransferase
VETRMRSDNRPWRPVAPGSADSPYRGPAARDDLGATVKFSAVELATGELVGEALLWGIDLHNRSAHIGISLRPAFRGRHLGTGG